MLTFYRNLGSSLIHNFFQFYLYLHIIFIYIIAKIQWLTKSKKGLICKCGDNDVEKVQSFEGEY